MSNLIKAIVTYNTGNRARSYPPLEVSLLNKVLTYEESFPPSINPNLVEFLVSAKFSNKCFVPEGDPNALEYAVRQTKQSIIQAVFGEFREDFLLINRALHQRNFEEAIYLLSKFNTKMYTDE